LASWSFLAAVASFLSAFASCGDGSRRQKRSIIAAGTHGFGRIFGQAFALLDRQGLHVGIQRGCTDA
jgi:hypothetical protein